MGGCSILRARRLRFKHHRMPIKTRAIPAIPPTTPPAIAPTLSPEDEEAAEGVVVAAAVEVAAAVAEVVMKAEATASSVLRLAAVKSCVGHPLEQGLLLQQPMKAGSVPAHVYQLLSASHVWSGNVPYSAVSKLAGLRFLVGQLVVSSQGSMLPVQHPTNLEPVVQAYQDPPLGQEGSNDWRGQRSRS